MNDAALIIDVDVERSDVQPSSAVVATKGIRWVLCLICSFGLATAFMSVASAIYKAPAGVFDGHTCAYYVSVITSGIMGLAEACAAVVWLSSAADDNWRKQLARRCVLCASLLPLAFMAGLGGVRILVK
ncbi:hypothetical protein CFC21_053828 [Triticum aestivum]|uniref:CASP-like protein n=2 Tax=Triticum aestivum TaxID=4565 RepID=A0A9R1GCP6_WHEAT|nr:hypothetical protein CFC21_053828 [Triticum aestivum]